MHFNLLVYVCVYVFHACCYSCNFALATLHGGFLYGYDSFLDSVILRVNQLKEALIPWTEFSFSKKHLSFWPCSQTSLAFIFFNSVPSIWSTYTHDMIMLPFVWIILFFWVTICHYNLPFLASSSLHVLFPVTDKGYWEKLWNSTRGAILWSHVEWSWRYWNMGSKSTWSRLAFWIQSHFWGNSIWFQIK